MMTLTTRSILNNLTFGKPYNVVKFEKEYLTIKTLKKYCNFHLETVVEKVKELTEDEVVEVMRASLEGGDCFCCYNGESPDYMVENHKFFEIKRIDCIVIESYKE